jgi:hypothetical protein
VLLLNASTLLSNVIDYISYRSGLLGAIVSSHSYRYKLVDQCYCFFSSCFLFLFLCFQTYPFPLGTESKEFSIFFFADYALNTHLMQDLKKIFI